MAPGGSGKTVLLVNLILRAYPRCFERVYNFSSTVRLDRAWDAVKKYQKDVAKIGDRERSYWADYDMSALQAILDRQMRATEIQQERGMKKPYSILIVVPTHPRALCAGTARL